MSRLRDAAAKALADSQWAVQARGHMWDIADVMAALDSVGVFDRHQDWCAYATHGVCCGKRCDCQE